MRACVCDKENEVKCMALRSKPSALIDVCIHLATTDDLHMQFDIVIIKHREQNMYSSVSVYKQQCMMVLKVCTGVYFMKTEIFPGILTVK